MQDESTTFDWIEKDTITEKIKACNTLLEMPNNNFKKTWFEKVANELHKLKVI